MLNRNSASQWNYGRRRRGYSLAEMLIVLFLMSILAAVAMPKWAGALQKNRVASAAGRIVADLARAQAAAYSTSSSKTVTFDVGASRYTISGVAPLNQAAGTYSVALTDDPYQCTLVSVWATTGIQTITFNGFGLPDKGGRIVVAAGDLQKTIVVNAESGTAVIK